MPEIKAGTVIQERYRVEKALGTGAASTVYLAYDQLLNRQVAMKFLHNWTDHLGAGNALRRFEREAQFLSQLLHPNIIRVYHFGLLDNKEAFLVMEYAQGETLRELLDRKKRLSCAETADIALQVCAALQFAHSAQIVHRDLKPENIMVVENPTDTIVKVLDFGLCKDLSGDAESPARTSGSTLTETGFVIGTTAYMSPEQGMGEPADCRSDIYSFGCIVFEMITGEPPFSAQTPAQVLLKHMSEAVPRILELSPASGLPCELQDLIVKCTAKNRNSRYQSFEELTEDLLAVAKLNSAAIFRPQAGATRRRLNKKQLALSLVVSVLGLVILSALFANTAEGKLFLAAQIQASLNADSASRMLLAVHKDLLACHNLAAARKLVESTISSHIYRNWPSSQKAELLESYIKSYRAAGQKDDAVSFSVRFLENTLDSVRHEQARQKPPARELSALKNIAKELYYDNLTKRQWDQICHVCTTRADAFEKSYKSYMLWPSALRSLAKAQSDPLLSEDARVELSKYYQYAVDLAQISNTPELLFSISKAGLELAKKNEFLYDEHLIRSALCHYYLSKGQKEKARQELASIEHITRTLLLSPAETTNLNDLRLKCGVGKIVQLPHYDDEDQPRKVRIPVILQVAGENDN
jgi:tRNA A-37 threonylcarbamoyl transferase component Bud32